MPRSLPSCATERIERVLAIIWIWATFGACADEAARSAVPDLPLMAAGSPAPVMPLTAAGAPAPVVPTLDRTFGLADAMRCAEGKGGNWVCSWPVDRWGAGGPCAIGPDGSLNVASSTISESGESSAALTRFDANGDRVWSRTWSRAH